MSMIYIVLNADGYEVARYELLCHATESAETNSLAGCRELGDFYSVTDENGADYGTWNS